MRVFSTLVRFASSCLAVSAPVGAAVAVSLAATTLPAPVASAADSKPLSAAQALAIRFCDAAQEIARTSDMSDAQLRRISALSVRYARLHADVLATLRDLDGAFDAAAAVRALSPEDRSAQIMTIDIHVARMQEVDQKLAYLRGLLPNDMIHADVRSLVAMRIADLLDAKGMRDGADAALVRAVELNPLNFTALAMQYERLPQSGTLQRRLTILTAMIRANPTQPSVSQQIGRLMGAMGMTGESVDWLYRALEAANLARTGPTQDLMMDLSSALMLAERYPQAQGVLDTVLSALPAEYSSLIMRSIAEARQGRPDAAKYRVRARNSLVNRLSEARFKLGVTGATTRPIDEGEIDMPRLADLQKDSDLLARLSAAEQRPLYLITLAELAWFQVYFNDQPADADSLIQLVNSILNDDERREASFIGRIVGWIYLKQGKLDEAEVKFSAVADRDPFALAGLARRLAAKKDPDKARTVAQQALDAAGSGFNGVVVADAVRDLGARPRRGEQAATFADIVNTLPPDWMNILGRPQAFYSITGQTDRKSSAFGQPIIVRVTIRNTSKVDLSLAADGVIKPVVCVDALVGGLFQQNIPAVAFEHCNTALVLKPRQSVDVLIRVDQGDLAGIMNQNPIAPVTFRLVARTNPLPFQDKTQSSAAGFPLELSQMFERAAFPAAADKVAAAAETIQSGSAEDRIRLLQLMTQIVLQARKQPESPAAPLVVDILPALKRATGQSDPIVRSYAQYCQALTSEASERLASIQRMASASEVWQCQLLAMMAMERIALPADRQLDLARQLADTAGEPLVKKFAQATIDLLQNPPAKKQGGPATRP